MARQWFLAIWWTACLAASPLYGQVVQLPTVHSFSIGTTVVVPDRGAAFLGGVNRAAYGSVSRGIPGLGPLFRSRSYGASVSSSTAYVTATIIDHVELDRAVLAEAARRRPAVAAHTEVERKAEFLAEHIQRRHAGALESVATERERARQVRSPDDEAREYFELARRAESAGCWGAARCQYKRVVLTGHGDLKTRAQQRLLALSVPGAEPKVAAR